MGNYISKIFSEKNLNTILNVISNNIPITKIIQNNDNEPSKHDRISRNEVLSEFELEIAKKIFKFKSIEETKSVALSYLLSFEPFCYFENQLKKNPGVFLFCNPHNPGGTVFTEEEIERIVFLCTKYDCMILSDEIHADLQLQTSQKHVCISKYISNELPAITFFATSKTYNTAGMGGAVAIIPNAKIREKYNKHIQGVLPMLSRHSIEIIQTSLTMNNEWLENLLIYLRINHQLLLSFIKQIKSLKMLPLEATYLAWIQYDEEILGDFQQRLFTNGLHVLRGDQFLGKNFIRVNIACTKNSLEKALLIIKKTIDEAH